MTQRHTNGTEEIIRTDGVGIPFGNRPSGYTERIFLTIGKRIGHGIDLHLQLALRMHPVDGLIVDHSTVVGEERAVLTGDIDQRGGKAIRA